MTSAESYEIAHMTPCRLRTEILSKNFRDINRRIDVATGNRSPVRLVAVSKYKPAADILALYNATAHLHMGENYVQELIEKSSLLPQDIRWHFIGQLQTNKCKLLARIPNLWMVESVDTIKKADTLNKARASSGNACLRVCVQVNTSGEDVKSGCPPSETLSICTHIHNQCSHLILQGLMTIGSLRNSQSGEDTNSEFLMLADIQKSVSSSLGTELELSMGMSQDFETAVRMGATNVRVGTAIFGARSSNSESRPAPSLETPSGHSVTDVV
ncbi:YggS family pyridoxal phosphate enzyme [Geopyxis carbonaria]|nr:YggS family pyridoxal phosphate enzyme [Geopyxis carbonaria]